jgi:nucleotide-binding universal stress UspA family protein
MVKHLLVAVEGSEGSRKAARFALDLANQTSARITLLFVLEPPRMIPIGPLDSFIEVRGSDAEHIEAAHQMLEEIASGFPADRMERRVELGHAADTICAQAEKLNADLSALGARGLNRFGRWFLGSVSDRVVHHATKPVVVVR